MKGKERGDHQETLANLYLNATYTHFKRTDEDELTRHESLVAVDAALAFAAGTFILEVNCCEKHRQKGREKFLAVAEEWIDTCLAAPSMQVSSTRRTVQ